MYWKPAIVTIPMFALFAIGLLGQQESGGKDPAFEVVSVKPSDSRVQAVAPRADPASLTPRCSRYEIER